MSTSHGALLCSSGHPKFGHLSLIDSKFAFFTHFLIVQSTVVEFFFSLSPKKGRKNLLDFEWKSRKISFPIFFFFRLRPHRTAAPSTYSLVSVFCCCRSTLQNSSSLAVKWREEGGEGMKEEKRNNKATQVESAISHFHISSFSFHFSKFEFHHTHERQRTNFLDFWRGRNEWRKFSENSSRFFFFLSRRIFYLFSVSHHYYPFILMPVFFLFLFPLHILTVFIHIHPVKLAFEVFSASCCTRHTSDVDIKHERKVDCVLSGGKCEIFCFLWLDSYRMNWIRQWTEHTFIMMARLSWNRKIYVVNFSC